MLCFETHLIFFNLSIEVFWNVSNFSELVKIVVKWNYWIHCKSDLKYLIEDAKSVWWVKLKIDEKENLDERFVVETVN